MILRFSPLVLALLVVSGPCLAVERTPSTVEVEEGSDPSDDAPIESAKPDDSRGEATVPTTEAAEESDADDAVETAPAAAVAHAAPVKAAPAPAALAPAQRERLAAFTRGPLRFSSVGKIKAFLIKIDRNLHYTMKPLARNGQVLAVAVTMVDRANGDKVTEGRLDVARNGALRARTVALTNACNIGSIDPVTRHKLMQSDGPVASRGQMEISGSVQNIDVTHTREGEVTEDGSMTVKSETETADGKVHLTTITELAPDGLPTAAETTGTIAKGPIDLNVNLKLTREGEGELETAGE